MATYLRNAGLACLLLGLGVPAADAAERGFDQVAKILTTRCLTCHNSSERSGGLDLSSSQTAFAGGDSGPVISAGEPDASLLIDRIESGEMPPDENDDSHPLPATEKLAVRQWVDQGAPWPKDRLLDLFEATTDRRGGRDWWSLQPIKRPALPVVQSTENINNPIDRFVQARLERAKLSMAPLADRSTLVRRVYIDLLGLPPTAAQIQRFQQDTRPDAYARLVEQLLASPQYGERWARFWLDVARYAETSGYERDQEKPGAWKYRDWVIHALNQDKPYDEFVVEQIAGDELPNRRLETVIATGFLRLGTWNDEPNDPGDYKYERLEDLVHATSSSFLGLTVKCARCHDHKFDPIQQVDYYRMAAAFWPGPIEPRERELLGGPTKDELGFDVLGWTDVSSQPAPLHLLRKGDPKHPEQAIPFGRLSFLSSPSMPESVTSPNPATTGRRWRLAQWIVDPHHPLTPRVIVNRLWQHHFGQGIVRSPNNFGFRGDQPTHPELLDWLAQELIQRQWQLKPLHRILLTSRTYQQSSVHPDRAEYRTRDAANRHWWHWPRKRLDAEALRDAMLLVSGDLDQRLGGPSFRPTISPGALVGLSRKAAAWQASPDHEQRRRSIYIFTQRSLLPQLMTTFDFCDTTLPCGQRDVTIVPTQALALLNNSFVHTRSQHMADRVLRLACEQQHDQVQQVWQLALARSPTQQELQQAVAHLVHQRSHFEQQNGSRSKADPARLALESLCHVVLNTNEFIFVD